MGYLTSIVADNEQNESKGNREKKIKNEFKTLNIFFVHQQADCLMLQFSLIRVIIEFKKDSTILRCKSGTCVEL
jgi:hypothetical protein